MSVPGAMSETKHANYLVRHWRGDLPLGISYWVNGAILGSIVPGLLLGALIALQSDDSGSLRAVALVQFLLIVVSVLVPIWSTIGIWRSSRKHVARGGKAFWAGAAQVAAVFGLLSLLGNLTTHNIGRQALESAQIAMGHDPLPIVKVTVAPNGQSVRLTGALGMGSAERVRTVLAATPRVRVIELDSVGGRLFEAKSIASDLARRNLNTYVAGVCMSACTMVFLAGKERAATPNARIGFHRASFGGESVDGDADAMLADYRKAGISKAFIERVKNTPSDSMWFPTQGELAANGITTRSSMGGETATDLSSAGLSSAADMRRAFDKQDVWRTVERRYPGSTARAADAAWQAHLRGANDNDVEAAGREVISALMPKALSEAPAVVLNSFLELSTVELTAALTVSEQTCQSLLAGKLDIRATLPAPVVAKDAAFTKLLFESAPQGSDATWSREAGAEAIKAAMDRLPTEHLQVLREHNGSTPCPVLIEFYKAVAALPQPQRTLALRAMFQS
jgi:hypothetical protein